MILYFIIEGLKILFTEKLSQTHTLKTMQLLGFNYKAAIGEPLTEICANAISKLGNKTTVSKRK